MLEEATVEEQRRQAAELQLQQQQQQQQMTSRATAWEPRYPSGIYEYVDNTEMHTNHFYGYIQTG